MQEYAAFTAKQARFIDEFLVDSNGAAAAIRAGYAPGSAKVAASRMLTKDNPVRSAIQARQDVDSARLGVTRDRVISRLLEAFDMAKEKREPMAMVRAAAEVGKMLGFYAPERKTVEIQSTEQSVSFAEMQAMSDAQLLALIEQGSAASH